MNKQNILYICLGLLVVCSFPWFIYWHEESYKKSFEDFKIVDYNIFTKTDLPIKYQEDFRMYQLNELDNLWIIDKEGLLYLVRKNVSI